jgi:hypothetical protein
MNLSWIKDHLDKSLYVALVLFALTFSAYKIEQELAWLMGVFSLTALIIILWVYRRIDNDLKSNDWFKDIVELLDDSTQAKIYLRSFQHPEEFHEKHRSELMKIMKIFARKMVENTNDFHIIAYRPSDSKGKNPIGWLKQEIVESIRARNADEILKKCITVIKSQPSANMSTVYMIDKCYLLYNRPLENHKIKYCKIDFSRSIIPYFFELGFNKYFNSEN